MLPNLPIGIIMTSNIEVLILIEYSFRVGLISYISKKLEKDILKH